jgi:hypothetical protein
MTRKIRDGRLSSRSNEYYLYDTDTDSDDESVKTPPKLSSVKSSGLPPKLPPKLPSGKSSGKLVAAQLTDRFRNLKKTTPPSSSQKMNDILKTIIQIMETREELLSREQAEYLLSSYKRDDSRIDNVIFEYTQHKDIERLKNDLIALLPPELSTLNRPEVPRLPELEPLDIPLPPPGNPIPPPGSRKKPLPPIPTGPRKKPLPPIPTGPKPPLPPPRKVNKPLTAQEAFAEALRKRREQIQKDDDTDSDNEDSNDGKRRSKKHSRKRKHSKKHSDGKRRKSNKKSRSRRKHSKKHSDGKRKSNKKSRSRRKHSKKHSDGKRKSNKKSRSRRKQHSDGKRRKSNKKSRSNKHY